MNSFLLWLNLSVANGFSDIKNPSNLSCLWRIIKILISSFVCDNHILFKAIRKMPPKTSFFLTECRTFHSFELVISSNIINMNLTSFRNENAILLQSKERWQIEHQTKYRHANDMRLNIYVVYSTGTVCCQLFLVGQCWVDESSEWQCSLMETIMAGMGCHRYDSIYASIFENSVST